jgi:apolipoprotein N-acyltransferase
VICVTVTGDLRDTKDPGARGITFIWIVLCAITIGSWWLSPAHGSRPAAPSVAITTAVMLLGLIKGRLIIQYFMEVRSAPRWLRWSTDAWLLVLWTSVFVIYLY